jgi:hypothetical protein
MFRMRLRRNRRPRLYGGAMSGRCGHARCQNVCFRETPIIRTCILLLFVLVIGVDDARAQFACASAVQQDLRVMDPDTSVRRQRTLREIRQTAEELTRERERRKGQPEDGLLGCRSAELFKRVGDLRSEQLFKAIILEDSQNAEYHLLYGDYLRNYRGPGQSLIDRAAEQYYEGLKTADTGIRNLIRRSLVALYERDGLDLTGSLDQKRPFLFFSSQITGAESPDDIAGVDTLRALTSAALLAELPNRVGHPLSSPDLEALVRDVWRGKIYQRVRARYGALAVDGTLDASGGIGSQVVRYDQPQSRGNVSSLLPAIGVEYVDSLYALFDFLIRGEFKVGWRRGLIEFSPNDDESVRSTNVHAVASRFVGPDKINIELSAGHDAATQQVQNPIDRNRTVWGVTGRYQMFRPLGGSRPYERPIASRGSEFFVGAAKGTEAFGAVDVARRDLFFGASLKGLPGGGHHSFDVTIQPTIFSYRREPRAGAPVDALENRQIETFVTLLYRIVDRENQQNIDLLPHLVFLNVVGLGSVGRARDGLDAFERNRIGAEVDAKFVGRQRGGVTWLISARYELQDFVQLGRRSNVFFASINMGF